MRKAIVLATTLVLFAVALGHQSPPKAGNQSALSKEWGALQRSYETALQEYYLPLRNAKTEEEAAKVKLDETKNPNRAFIPKIHAFAVKAKNRPEAAEAWLFLARISAPGFEATNNEAIVKLTTTFVKSPQLEGFCGQLPYMFYEMSNAKAREAKQLKLLRTIEAKNPLPGVKAAAIMAQAEVIGDASPEKAQQQIALINSVMEKYPTTRYGKLAKAKKFEAEFLSVGKPAPDFEAKDENDVSFKLSEYKGKVVVLDFWGFW